MTYEQLDVVADAYIPILILVSIATLVTIVRKRSTKDIYNVLIVLAGGIFQTYAVMILDNALGLWPLLNLDYSTHTSLALVFVVYLAFISSHLFVCAVGSMLFYIALMLYQEYHSLLDVLVTTIAILPGLLWLNIKFNHSARTLVFFDKGGSV